MISALPEIDAEISSKTAEQSKAKGSLKSLNVSEWGGGAVPLRSTWCDPAGITGGRQLPVSMPLASCEPGPPIFGQTWQASHSAPRKDVPAGMSGVSLFLLSPEIRIRLPLCRFLIRFEILLTV